MKIHTYKDELKEKDPSSLLDRYIGGVNGCPGDYFFGAPVFDRDQCSPLQDRRCRTCWAQPYAQERWCPNDE